MIHSPALNHLVAGQVLQLSELIRRCPCICSMRAAQEVCAPYKILHLAPFPKTFLKINAIVLATNDTADPAYFPVQMNSLSYQLVETEPIHLKRTCCIDLILMLS